MFITDHLSLAFSVCLLALNKVQLRLMGFILQIFSHKPKHWTNYNFDQIVPEEKTEITKSLGFILWDQPTGQPIVVGQLTNTAIPGAKTPVWPKKTQNFYIFQPPNPQVIVFV